MNDFIFHSPTKFVFGRGVVDRTGAELASLGFRKALVVTGGSSAERTGTLARVLKSLDAAGVAHVHFPGVRPNPEIEQVRAAIAMLRSEDCDVVLPVGGGSVIDCAKAVAFAADHPGDPWDFFDHKAKITASRPVAAVLTIPAAGSEGSASCVISNDALGAKRGTGSDAIRPVLAIMDPELTFTLPPYQTAAGVTDMTAHICERYFSGAPAVPVSDNIAAGIIRALLDAAPRALRDPGDYDARATIMWCGTLAHNDLTGCGLGFSLNTRAGGWESHALEHELSAFDPKITHGAGLAVMMPAWMRYVSRTLPVRFISFGRDVFGMEPSGDLETSAKAAIDKLQDFFISLGMPRTLSDFGIDPACIDRLVSALARTKGEVFGSYMKLTSEDTRAIYESAF